VRFLRAASPSMPIFLARIIKSKSTNRQQHGMKPCASGVCSALVALPPLRMKHICKGINHGTVFFCNFGAKKSRIGFFRGKYLQ
jgi:hypothetical protein